MPKDSSKKPWQTLITPFIWTKMWFLSNFPSIHFIQFAPGRVARGKLYFAQKKMDEALVDFDAAVRINEKDIDSMLTIANIQNLRGHFENVRHILFYILPHSHSQSLPWYARVLSLNSDSIAAYSGLGICYYYMVQFFSCFWVADIGRTALMRQFKHGRRRYWAQKQRKSLRKS